MVIRLGEDMVPTDLFSDYWVEIQGHKGHFWTISKKFLCIILSIMFHGAFVFCMLIGLEKDVTLMILSSLGQRSRSKVHVVTELSWFTSWLILDRKFSVLIIIFTRFKVKVTRVLFVKGRLSVDQMASAHCLDNYLSQSFFHTLIRLVADKNPIFCAYYM